MSRLLPHHLLHIPTSRSTLLLSSPPNFRLPPAFYLIRNQVRFSGHNKWSKIRHGKGLKDSAKSTYFHRLTKDISLAVKGMVKKHNYHTFNVIGITSIRIC